MNSEHIEPTSSFTMNQDEVHPLLRMPTPSASASLPFFNLEDYTQGGKPEVPLSSVPYPHIYPFSMPESKSHGSFDAIQQRQALDASLLLASTSANPFFFASTPLPFLPSPPHADDDMDFLLNQLSRSQPVQNSGGGFAQSSFPICTGSPATPATPPYLSRPQTPKHRVIVRVNTPNPVEQPSPLPKGKYIDNGVLIGVKQPYGSSAPYGNSPESRLRTRTSETHVSASYGRPARRGSEPYIITRRPQPPSPNNSMMQQPDSPSQIFLNTQIPVMPMSMSPTQMPFSGFSL